MPEELDELFGEGAGAPRPRAVLVIALLASGVLTAVAGLVCSVAPGGVLVLLSWMTVEKEMDRLESGYLPAGDRPRVMTLRYATYAGLALVIVLFVVQGYLLCNTPIYEQIWGSAIAEIRQWLGVDVVDSL